MKISELLQPQRPSLSFELFPPRDDIGFWDLYKTIEAIIQAAKTGQIGDGKIFVTALEQAVRIRTGEAGTDAL